MELKLSIFPFKAKYLGLALIIFAVPLAYLYFWGGKPEVFNIKIFAIVTTYLETRYFVVSQTNILDELAAIFFLLGITLISFSKERDEKRHFDDLRVKALIRAVFITLVFWILSFLLVYGIVIFLVSFSVFIVFLISYNVLLRYYFFKSKSEK